MTRIDPPPHRLLVTVLMVVGVAVGTLAAVLTSDGAVGVIVGASFIALSVQVVMLGERPRPAESSAPLSAGP